MNYLLGLMVLAAFASPSFAGEGGANVGNGGDGVLCTDVNGNKTVELLDYYEARVLRGISPNLGDPTLSVDEQVELLLSRLAPVSPLRAEQYLRQAKAFMSETAFVPGARLVDVPDSNHMVIPENCAVIQVVIQQKIRFKQDKRYIVDEDIWNLMDNANKAGMIVHEVIYREAIVNGQQESVRTRYFNSLIAGDRLNGMTETDFYRLVSLELEFYYSEANGVIVLASNSLAGRYTTFHKNGRLQQGLVAAGTIIPVEGQNHFTQVNLLKADLVAFDEKGRLNWQNFVKAWNWAETNGLPSVRKQILPKDAFHERGELVSLSDDSGKECQAPRLHVRGSSSYAQGLYFNITNCRPELVLSLSKTRKVRLPIERVTYAGTTTFYVCNKASCESQSKVEVTYNREYDFWRGSKYTYKVSFIPAGSKKSVKATIESKWAKDYLKKIYE